MTFFQRVFITAESEDMQGLYRSSLLSSAAERFFPVGGDGWHRYSLESVCSLSEKTGGTAEILMLRPVI